MTQVSRNGAGLLFLAAVAVGVLVGALGFSGSPGPEGSKRPDAKNIPPDANGEARWLSGPAADRASLLGPSLVKDVYLGLSCPTPNSIACDRVTIAVTVAGDAKEMRVWVAGRPVEMHSPRERGRGYWEGSLESAGLLEGPLKQEAKEGDLRWVGDPTVAAEVTIEIETPTRDSILGIPAPSFSATYDSVVLNAGYG